MEKNESQFPAISKPHARTEKNNARIVHGSSEVNLGQTTSVVHSPGTPPISHTVPHFSGKGTAKELGVIFKMINQANK